MPRLRKNKGFARSILLEQGLKRCTRCKRIQPLANFSNTGWYCRDCAASINRGSREGRFIEPPSITIEAMMDLQNGLCVICADNIDHGGKHAFDIDHIAGTDIICGLLCPNCNTGIGKLRHSIPILEEAIDYIFEREMKYLESLSPEELQRFKEETEHESMSATLWEGHF